MTSSPPGSQWPPSPTSGGPYGGTPAARASSGSPAALLRGDRLGLVSAAVMGVVFLLQVATTMLNTIVRPGTDSALLTAVSYNVLPIVALVLALGALVVGIIAIVRTRGRSPLGFAGSATAVLHLTGVVLSFASIGIASIA